VPIQTPSFADGLRAALREDADIVLVGEMRDLETISLALTAAETGLLVFGTLHTNNARKTVDRIIDVFPSDQQARSAPCLPLRSRRRRPAPHEEVRRQRPCRRERDHGLHPAVGAIIREGATQKLYDVIIGGKAQGMQFMDEAIWQKLRDGYVSPMEAYMKAIDKNRFKAFLPPEDLPEPTSLFQALEAPAPAPSADATWVLGVEPLPSLNEGTAFPSVASSMFASAPGQNEEQAFPPPQFTPPTFQGAAFPDEIEVAAPPEPAHELSPPVVHITPTLPPSVNFPAAAAESESRPDDAPPVAEIVAPQSEAPEIAVHLAATGEASFDPPPLAEVPDNPWQPAPELSSTPPVAPPPAPPMNGPVVDAEIVLRPRAPMQNAVVAKTKPVSPRFAKNEPQAEPHDIPPADNKQGPTLPPAPVQTPREQRARSTWRSWWRGE
jgi:hypothetical protein